MTLTLCRIQLWADWVINSENLCLLVQRHLLQCRLLSLSLTIKDNLPHGSWSRRHLVSDLLCETKANLNRFVALWPDALLINSGKGFLTTWSLSIVIILSHLLLDAYICVKRSVLWKGLKTQILKRKLSDDGWHPSRRQRDIQPFPPGHL